MSTASAADRRVPESFSRGLDCHNAEKAWLSGYDAGVARVAALEAENQQLREGICYLRGRLDSLA